ncbi:MAG TPA: hypothetical protein VJ652_13745, partial [Noviherbaspirillum sp.]|nr:hypothetical protein [Noviherbaspirillum sp.]
LSQSRCVNRQAMVFPFRTINMRHRPATMVICEGRRNRTAGCRAWLSSGTPRAPSKSLSGARMERADFAVIAFFIVLTIATVTAVFVIPH